MDASYLEVVMGLIMHGGNAKGLAYEAIQKAKESDFASAEESLKQANKELAEAHDVQTKMLVDEANGIHAEINLYMVHAQDHLMTAIAFRDVAVELIEQEKRLQALEKLAN